MLLSKILKLCQCVMLRLRKWSVLVLLIVNHKTLHIIANRSSNDPASECNE